MVRSLTRARRRASRTCELPGSRVRALGSAALADSFAVSASPTSSVQVDLYTNPQDAYVDTLGPNDVSGSADVTVSVGLGGNGSFDFNSASLSVANQTVTLTLPSGLGTVDVVMDSVGMGLVSTGGIPVVGNQWNLSSIGAPSSFTVSFNAGTMTLDNATGLAVVFLTTPAVIDLAANPINFTLPSLVAAGVSGTADSTSISMVMSNVQIEGFIDAGGLFLDGQMSGSLYTGNRAGTRHVCPVRRRFDRSGSCATCPFASELVAAYHKICWKKRRTPESSSHCDSGVFWTFSPLAHCHKSDLRARRGTAQAKVVGQVRPDDSGSPV